MTRSKASGFRWLSGGESAFGRAKRRALSQAVFPSPLFQGFQHAVEGGMGHVTTDQEIGWARKPVSPFSRPLMVSGQIGQGRVRWRRGGAGRNRKTTARAAPTPVVHSCEHLGHQAGQGGLAARCALRPGVGDPRWLREGESALPASTGATKRQTAAASPPVRSRWSGAGADSPRGRHRPGPADQEVAVRLPWFHLHHVGEGGAPATASATFSCALTRRARRLWAARGPGRPLDAQFELRWHESGDHCQTVSSGRRVRPMTPDAARTVVNWRRKVERRKRAVEKTTIWPGIQGSGNVRSGNRQRPGVGWWLAVCRLSDEAPRRVRVGPWPAIPEGGGRQVCGRARCCWG